jgi:phosphoribosyl-AMP cyclohydrolase
MTAIEQLDSAELLAAIRFDADGLVPVIAQRHGSGEILMWPI